MLATIDIPLWLFVAIPEAILLLWILVTDALARRRRRRRRDRIRALRAITIPSEERLRG